MGSLSAPLSFPLGGDTGAEVVPAAPSVARTAQTADLPRTLLLDENGNVDLTSGNLVLATREEAIRTNVFNRLQVFKGEWFLDEDEGLPYFQTILVKNPDTDLIRSAFRERILATPGVTALEALTMTIDARTRELSVAYVAQTDAGLLRDAVPVGIQ